MTVAEMMTRMSSAEYSAWQVFDSRIEPIGDRRADLRAGGISATVANVYRDEKKRRQAFAPSDFALDFNPLREQTYEDRVASNLSKLQALQVMFGRAIKVVKE